MKKPKKKGNKKEVKIVVDPKVTFEDLIDAALNTPPIKKKKVRK